jgi:hypothetical protein
VEEVIDHLAALGPITITEHAVTIETIRFALPPQLRTDPAAITAEPPPEGGEQP